MYTYMITCMILSMLVYIIENISSDPSTAMHHRNTRLALPRGRVRLELTRQPQFVQYAGARSSVGRRFRSVTKLRLEWYGGVSLLLQTRSKHPREMVITPKASTSLFCFNRLGPRHAPRRRSCVRLANLLFHVHCLSLSSDSSRNALNDICIYIHIYIYIYIYNIYIYIYIYIHTSSCVWPGE